MWLGEGGWGRFGVECRCRLDEWMCASSFKCREVLVRGSGIFGSSSRYAAAPRHICRVCYEFVPKSVSARRHAISRS